MASGGAGGGGAGDVSGADESNAYGTAATGVSDPATGVSGAVGPGGGFDVANDIGNAISGPEAAAITQARENDFGPQFAPQQTSVQSFLSNPLISDLGRLSPTPGSLLMSLVTAPMGPLGLVPGLIGLANKAAGGTPGSDVDAYGAQVGDVGTGGFGGAPDYETEEQQRLRGEENYLSSPSLMSGLNLNRGLMG